MTINPCNPSLPPRDINELFLEGSEYLDLGHLEVAARRFEAVLEIDPAMLEAHYNLGLAYQGMARNEAAKVCYQRALAIRPDYVNALNNLGQVLDHMGEHSAAEATYRQALSIDPHRVEPHFNLAELAVKHGDLTAAVTHYRRAIQIRPDMVEAYNNLGTVFQKQSNYQAAEKCYRQVVALKPELAQGYYNIGSALMHLDKFEEAIHNFQQALRLKPDYKEAFNNLALVYKNTAALDRADKYFSEALAIDPEFAEAHWNLSFTYLLKGDFKRGWQHFEWRFEQPKWSTLYPFRLAGERWNGTQYPNQRILVHDEQGLGDTFQFVRYLPLVKERGGTVLFETRRSLMPILDGFPGIDHMIERSTNGRPAASYDLIVPLMSLPYIFNTTLESIPNKVPYLAAKQEKIAHWRHRVSGRGLKVGIVWAGRPEHLNDKNRSCRLEQFASLSDSASVQWYGLQKGPAADQAQAWSGVGSFSNLGDDFEDFSDTAGAIANLDLVITVDTSVAHLAGAIGKPVWILLPYVPDWRWMMGREDSPWYPTARLFRQPGIGDWDSVFNEIRSALKIVEMQYR